MAVGQSIAPTSDITMRIPGAMSSDAARKSIDPTDYMGQSFAYEQWLNAKKKEYEAKQQGELDKVLDRQRNELPVIAKEKAELAKKIEDYRLASEYKKAFDSFSADQEKAKAQWNASHGPVMGGRFEYKVYAIDKYLADYNSAKSDIDKAYTTMSQAKTQKDYDDASVELNKATSRFEEIGKLSPDSDKFKEKYKDEIKEGYNQGINYAAGWGEGGYHGTGPGSTGLRDQLLANATGSKVGGAIPAVLKTPTETMTGLGFSIDKESNKWVDKKGNEYIGEIPKEYKLIESGISADVVKNMLANFNKAGQRPTNEQLTDAAKVSMLSETIKQQNKLMDLSTYAKMFPTPENKAKVAAYADEISDPRGSDAKYKEILQGLKDIAGVKDITSEITKVRTGSIMGADIYSSLKGGEYVKAPSTGKEFSLADVADQRRLAGKTGEYTLYNFPGYGGADSLSTQSEGAKQWLYSNFGEAGKVTEKELPVVGTTMVEGRSLDIVQSGGRDFVRPETGSMLIPLSTVTNLKNLSTKSGEYKHNTDVYDREMDYIKSFKNYKISGTPESRVAVVNAYQNLASDPNMTRERLQELDSMTSLGSLYAGTKLDSSGKLVYDPNIAKGILAFTSKPIVENAVRMNLLAKEDVDNPVVNDIIKKMPKYGDPIVGIVNLSTIVQKNANSGNSILNIDPKVNPKEYSKIVERLARASASGEATNFDQYVNVPEYMKTGVDLTKPLLQQNLQQETAGPQVWVNPKSSSSVSFEQIQANFGGKVKEQSSNLNIGNISTGVNNVTASLTNTTGKAPSRTDLRTAVVDFSAFKRKPIVIGAGPMSLGNVTNLTAQRKSKKSKPKADLKGKKNKKDKSSGLDNLAKNISKFTMSFTGKKKKGKVKNG